MRVRILARTSRWRASAWARVVMEAIVALRAAVSLAAMSSRDFVSSVRPMLEGLLGDGAAAGVCAESIETVKKVVAEKTVVAEKKLRVRIVLP